MTGQEVRHQFMRQLTGMTRYSRGAAGAIVALYIAQILLGVAAGHYLLSLESSVATVVLMALASVFIGTRLRGLNNIVHECTHSSFSEHRGDNETIGRFCAALLTGCFKQYKDDHLSHHAHLGDYEHDREMSPIEKFGLHEPLTPKTILRHIITPLLGRHLKMYSGVNLSNGDGAIFFGLKISLLVAIGIFSFLEPITSLLFVLVPLFYLFPTFNFWTDCLDHAGIVGEEDELEASRNVLAPLPLRLLFFPRNDCFHLVHHLFPQVPARHLETAHLALSENEAYQSLGNAVRPAHRAITEVAISAQ